MDINLKVFNGLFLNCDHNVWKELPIIHVYTFISIQEEIEYKQVLCNKVKKYCPLFVEEDLDDIHCVRDVSASKRMYCVSFKLSK